MSNLILRKLIPSDEEIFRRAAKEWLPKDRHWISLCWKEEQPFVDLFAALDKQSRGIGIPIEWVPFDTLYAFANNDVVGRLSIRHRLTDELKEYGGHVGYSVAPKYRRMRYGTAMLKAALPLAKKIGIDRLLITCDIDNIGSYKIIEKNGGYLDDIVKRPSESGGTLTRKYWIEL